MLIDLIQIESEFKFLKDSTPETFVESWRKVEKQIVARGKDSLKTQEAKTILEKIKKAEDDYGQSMEHEIFFTLSI